MEKLSTWRTATLGFQHVLAMYAGAVVVPLIVGPAIGMTPSQIAFLISIDFLGCGIATLIQVVGGKHFGIRLPVVLGCAFQAVAPMIAIGKSQGIPAIYGAIIGAGILVMLLSQFFGKILRFFPPIVTGSVVMIIGLSLIPVAVKNAAGGEGSLTFGSIENLILAAITLVIVIAINRLFKGYIQAIAVLLGLIFGTIVAAFMGKVDFKPVAEAGWFHIVQPFYFGFPEFHISSILALTLVGIVSMIETTGVFMALGEVCEKKLSPADIKKGLRAEGMAQVVGGIFNSFPYTSFSQNVGLVALTRVKNNKVVIAAGIILILLALLPKVAAITTLIPNPVLGGAMIPMFGMVCSSGVRMLSKVDFRQNENLLIIACSVGVGLGAAVVPQLFSGLPEGARLFFENGIVVGSMTAVILNIVFNRGKKAQKTENMELESMINEQLETADGQGTAK
ncbi:nucleobase:cation symporter-2 family protein [Thermoflavimicrobium dichotomicum]|uniref:Xanthine permease n=1 Tax=Thermoflavimicrobium dichotomicum TaxID=46223 RepID=A0A1I3T173_9BACL|nr:nucleobase:cation symporter-2 family protein [Thermoflavimicrobium dichotomicum]SFJ63426.1 xanthine permease [Thermoflavimicrobium dichotomicum]